MKVLDTAISGVKIEPDVFKDARNAPQKALLSEGRFGRRLYGKVVRKRLCLVFNAPALKIEWPKIDMSFLLSEKDQKHPPLTHIEPYIV